MQNEEVFEQVVESLRDDQVCGTPLIDLAEDIGVAHATLYNWIDGKVTSPRSDTLAKVAGYYGYVQEWKG